MNRFALLPLLLLSCILMFTAPASAQKTKTKKPKAGKVHPDQIKGDEHYAIFEYYQAALDYKKVLEDLPDNMYCTYRLAECYREYFDYANAEKYYKKVVDKDVAGYPLSRFWYAIMLRDNGRYEAAKNQFQIFLTEYKVTTLSAEEYRERARRAVEGLEMAMVEMTKPQRDYQFKCLPAPVNTEYSEYSPVIYGPDDSIIVVTSSRKGTTGNEVNMMLGGNMSDNYRFVYDGKTWIDYVAPTEDNFAKSNSMYNESPGSFTADGSKFYFTRCDEKIAIGKFEDFNCVIYVMKKNADGTWSDPVRLNTNVNMPGQWNSQPSISPDGKILFFTSKRPGGIGMHDIWYCTSGGDDNWGQAYNLGAGVNTLFSDMSPRYYGDEKLLYFASNGHVGFGGLDIFMAKEEENFETATNIGMPFNSHRDDFYYVMGKKKGYLASNRQGGLGNDDIYTFNVKAKEEALITAIDADSIPHDVKSISIVGTLVDDKGNKASNVDVALTDGDKQIKVTKTNEEGLFRFDNLPAGTNYKVVLLEKDATVTQKISYNVDSIQVQASNMAAKRTLFENIYFDFNRSEIRPEAAKTLDELIAYAKKYPEIQIELNANTDGLGTDTYNRVLSERRGQAAIDYLVLHGIDRSRIVMNPLGKERPLTSNDNEIGRQLNRRVEFYILGGPGYETKNMTYVVEPKATLYTIAQKFNMTVEELREINALNSDQVIPFTPLRVRRNVGDNDIIAQVTMQESMQTSHEDEKKSKKYYKELAVKNAAIEDAMQQSNLELLEQNKIIEAKNVEIQQNLALKKQQNVSLKAGEDLYKVRPKNTLFTISKLYRMTVEDLKALNQLTYDTIYINQLIKVKTGIYAPTANEYLVKEGDTVESIAAKFNITKEQLYLWNPLEGYTLHRNMILWIKKD